MRTRSGSLRAVLIAALLYVGGTLSGRATQAQPQARQQQAPNAAPTADASRATRYPLIPWPRRLEAREGAFELDGKTRVLVSDLGNEKASAPARMLATLVRNATTLPMRVTAANRSADALVGALPENTIAFMLTEDAKAGEEDGAYQLDVTPRAVAVRASTPKGLFYGMQTLRQLLPVEVERGLNYDDGRIDWSIPAVRVEDAPRFAYRGSMLDVGRHFFDVPFIKEYIDLLALYKLDRFHWHLTEDQGWRIEIKEYPRLTEVGACRDSSMAGHYRQQTWDGAAYCGYYTQEEVKEVVAYAQERHVTVIPEIEMPGHSSAALAAYPELGCAPEDSVAVSTTWGVHEDLYCPKEETFTFLENVLTEVMDLFPSTYIHIGGDEAPKTAWEESDVAQAVMKREGLDSEEELQSYFIRRIETFLNEHGRQIIGWDEILQGGLAPGATVMSWQGVKGGVQAARQGHDAIMAPKPYMYFDNYQADPDTEPLTLRGNLPLDEVYGYEPVPDSLSPQAARHIIGVQGNVWTEYMKTPAKVEYMAFPRVLALAEIAWSPAEARDWGFFKARLPAHLRRLDALEVGYRPPDFLTSEGEK